MKSPRWPARALGGIALAVALAGCGGSNDSANRTAEDNRAVQATTPTAVSIGPSSALPAGAIGERVQPAGQPRDVSPFKPRSGGTGAPPHQIALGAMEPERPSNQKSGTGAEGGPTKIGALRQVSETAGVPSTQQVLSWIKTSDGGRTAALRFSASGAEGLRLGVLVRGLPLGSLLRFFADGSDQAFEVTAQQIFRMIQRNKDAGDTSDAASTYWSPNLGGDAVTMEVVLPPGAAPDGVQIAIPSLSHIFTNLKKTGIRKAGDAGSCEQDVACSAEFLPLSPSVASMDFVKPDGVYICTGTLLNDRASDGIPYFLSAAHCIDNQTVASSLYTYWNWRKKTCGGSEYFQGNGTNDLLAGGATLLFTSAATDTTLLRLEDAPPPGAIFAASYSALPQSSDVVSSVHHPRGDVQKYSVGTYQGTYREFGSTLMTAALSGASDANYIGTRWSTGVTEKGSSGGPLFLKLNGIPYVIGQLHGGASSCANPFGTDFYGRFDRAFANGMSTWLAPYSSQVKVPIYRFYNTHTRSHFYTIDQGERDLVITRYKEWSYEGVSFYAYGAQHTGTQPVYRFYSTQTGSHFFTMDEGEKQHIVANFPWWKFEGIAWYANTATADGATSLYRFYNGKQGTHFFTASQTERDYIIGHYAEWSYEGVGYQVWMGP